MLDRRHCKSFGGWWRPYDAAHLCWTGLARSRRYRSVKLRTTPPTRKWVDGNIRLPCSSFESSAHRFIYNCWERNSKKAKSSTLGQCIEIKQLQYLIFQSSLLPIAYKIGGRRVVSISRSRFSTYYKGVGGWRQEGRVAFLPRFQSTAGLHLSLLLHHQ